MRRVAIIVSILFLAAMILSDVADVTMAEGEKPFAPNVDMQTGDISVPENYIEWPTLGTWAHANAGMEMKQEMGPGVHEYHVVYTQIETLQHYRKTGRFPDGAVLVKELLKAETMAMKTGPAVGHGTTIKGWFVMVRDTQGRFEDSDLWGDGWGWSLFDEDNPKHTVSWDYRSNCIPCHVPAKKLAPPTAVKADKWIYTLGYPVFRTDRR